MTLDKLWAYAGGFVRLRVTGSAKERFVNLATARGHCLWRIRRTARGLDVNTSIASFRRMRPVARRTRSGVKILERHGLPFALARLRRRPLFVIGALASLAGLYLMSSTIWFVRIEGHEQLDPALVGEVVQNLGLRPGLPKWSLDARAIERNLLLAVDGISWVAVDVRGVVAVVRIVEKTPLERPDIPTPPADVVAAKGGVITDVIVLAGRAVVSEGDTVGPGDPLILGRETAPGHAAPPVTPGDPSILPGPEVDVVARGLVRARVWYQAYAEASLHFLGHEPTGRVWHRLTLRCGAWGELPLLGWWHPTPGTLYERHEERLSLLFGRSGEAAVEVIATTYVEIRDVILDLTPAEAEQAARDAAAASLTRLLPQGAGPVSYRFEVTRKDDILVGVLAAAETVEDIARIRQRPTGSDD